MKIIKYTSEHKNAWNDFIKNSKNSHFFFYRDYLEYHSDRFKDYSLLIYDDKNRLISLLPANIDKNTLHSHQGLTFGGFISDNKMKAELMLDIFNETIKFLKSENISLFIYKCIPYIYHLNPSDEDKYALFRNNAKLIRRDVSTTINLDNQIKYQEQRKRAIKKAVKNELIFEESKNYKEFWNILEETLSLQHDTKPVHSIDEIESLILKFPNNIKLFVAKHNDKILGGTLIFINKSVVHTQYLANSLEGRTLGALDFVIDILINKIYCDKRFFDFGISNEDSGKYLNSGLISQKEGFGGRSIVHDFYELEIK